MDDQNQNDTPQSFSYPNADRPLPGSPQDIAEQTPKPRPTVHLQDALSQKTEADPSIRPIKTFQSDVANAIKNDNVSMIKIALAEKKRQDKQGTYEEATTAPKTIKIIVISALAIVALLVIGGAAFIYLNKTSTAKKGAELVIPVPQSKILEFEDRIPYDLQGKDLRAIETFVQKQKTVKIELGDIQQLVFTMPSAFSSSTEVTSKEFLNKIKSRQSDVLTRSLKDEFAFGIYSLNPRDSFFIFKIDPESYDNAFAGMLDWEKYLEDDLGGMLITKIPTATIDVPTGSTTASIFRHKPFVDRVVQNKDARVLLDDYGRVRMLYTFADESTIIFASSESMLKELLIRLTTGRIVR